MAVRQTRQQPETYDLGPLRLYRDDLQAIAKAMSELGDLKITCVSGESEYEASEPDDFEDIPEKLQSITISAYRKSDNSDPYRNSNVRMATTLGENRYGDSKARVEFTQPDTQAAGVLSRIRDICEQRKRLLWAICRRGGLILIGIGIIGNFADLIAYNETSHSSVWKNVYLNDGLPITWLALILIGLLARFAARPQRIVLINALKIERPSYWNRTRDVWVIGVITAIVGALIGYILGKL